MDVYHPRLLPELRYTYCPHCRAALVERDGNDGIVRASCPSCGFTHYPRPVVGVNTIVLTGVGVVALLPPGAPLDAPAALPGGHVEYGESPAQAAIREVREETGLDTVIERSLGWQYLATAEYPGDIVTFFYVARAVGGNLRPSEEGNLGVYPKAEFPAIDPRRTGSLAAWHRFISGAKRRLS